MSFMAKSKKPDLIIFYPEDFHKVPSNPQYPDDQLIQDFIDNCDKVIPPNILDIPNDRLIYFDKTSEAYLTQLQNEFKRINNNPSE